MNKSSETTTANQFGVAKHKLTQFFSLKTVSLSFLSVWLLLFACIPFLMIVLLSFLSSDPNEIFQWQFTLNNFSELINYLYIIIFLRSLLIASITTLCTLILAYPFAFFLAKKKNHVKNLLILLVMIPFWTSSLIRTYAMITLLKTHGLINSLLFNLGIIHHPLALLYNNTAVIISLVYNLLPFMILPLTANMERLNTDLFTAAADLGASKFIIFKSVLLPQTWPGIFAGSILVFLPAMTIFYIPEIVGGAKSLLLGNLIEDQFVTAQNWPLGAAISLLLIVLMILFVGIFWKKSKVKENSLLL